MKVQITDRFDPAKVLFEADIDKPEGTSKGVLLGACLLAAFASGADLSGANLSGADLRSANLRSADLTEAKHLFFQIPQEGDLFAWKKLFGGVIAKLLIPATAKRTATPIGRKCRAEEAKVLALFSRDGVELPEDAVVSSNHDYGFTYRVGQVVKPTAPYDGDIRVECTSGIHFYVTREEAEAH